MSDLRPGRTIPNEASCAMEVKKRLLISPLGVVRGSKLRIIHDSSFSLSGDRSSFNPLTDDIYCRRLCHWV